MEFILDLPTIAWMLTFALIALLIPVWVSSKVLRTMVKTSKKTYHSIRH